METCLGWVLSGLVKNDYANNNAVQKVFKITKAQIDTTSDLIKENNKSLIESENSIEYKDRNYTVKLPWKGEYKNIPGNFIPARNRLFSLLKRLKKS